MMKQRLKEIAQGTGHNRLFLKIAGALNFSPWI